MVQAAGQLNLAIKPPAALLGSVQAGVEDFDGRDPPGCSIPRAIDDALATHVQFFQQLVAGDALRAARAGRCVGRRA